MWGQIVLTDVDTMCLRESGDVRTIIDQYDRTCSVGQRDDAFREGQESCSVQVFRAYLQKPGAAGQACCREVHRSPTMSLANVGVADDAQGRQV
jgi:hypothetical protein